MREVALAAVGVDEGHAIAVDGQIGNKQQHFLTVAKGAFCEAEGVVECLGGSARELIKQGNSLCEQIFHR